MVFQEAIEGWLAEKENKRGRPKVYSNEAILCALMVKAVYNCPFRALRGLLLSLTALLGIALPIPCYTRICRRAKELGQKIKKLSNKRPTDLVFDSTGLKVYGEGEWKVRKHGASKRRTWKKIHLAVCPDSHDIILECLTGNDASDCKAFSKMKNALPQSIKRGYGDGAYDKTGCYRIFHALGLEPIVPPQRNAVLQDEEIKPWMKPRNDALRQIAGLGGDENARQLWKKLVGYHKRSIAETAMYRFKRLFGGSLSCRKDRYQKAEVFAKCLVMNRMNSLGMPKGKWIIV
ncbi:MAG: IS5 family transposase [Chlamydiales bacterium]|nr:IS5 family transposase [Chlamydiales bacterium]